MRYWIGRRRAWRGARLMDKVKPEWAKQIDLNRLRMEDAFWCVLGQVYGSFALGQRILGLTRNEALRYGFVSDSWDNIYQELQWAWKDQILKRIA